MRHNIRVKNSTKAERIVYEVLKEMRVPFKHRWLVDKMEIDFIIGKYTLEINGHKQNTDKNARLVRLGYIPIHKHNSEVTKESIKLLINKLKK